MTAAETPAVSQAASALLVVVNAHASGTSADLRHLRDAFATTGVDVEYRITDSVDELEAAWRDDDGRRIVLAGGDGSVHAVAGFEGPQREIALIPCGKANNIARCLGIPLHAPAAAELAAHGAAQPVDAIRARTPDGRTQIVVESVSVGFLAQARVRYDGVNSGDVVAGGLAGAAALTHFHPMAVEVVHEHTRETLQLAQLFVANLPLYEFGLRVAPFADPTDATLDVIGIEAASRHAVLGMIKHLREGSHVGRPGFHLWRAPRVEIRTSQSSPIVADSTNLGSGPVDLSALPAALHIVRP